MNGPDSDGMYATVVLPWIVLGHDIVAFAMSIISFLISGILLKMGIQNCITVPFSPTMYFYFSFVFIASIINCCYSFYLIIFWRHDKVIYDAIFLYISGHIATFMEANVPLVEFFLCIDRILSVIFPSRYNRTRKCYIAFLTFLFVFAISVFSNTFLDILTRIPQTSETDCRYLSCLKMKDANAFRVIKKAVIACFNLISAFTLGYLMKLKMTHAASIKRLNQVVLHMMIISFFLDFLPNCVASIGLVGYDMIFTKYIGPYSSTFTTINIAACCILYWEKFKHSLRNTFIGTTTTATATTTATNTATTTTHHHHSNTINSIHPHPHYATTTNHTMGNERRGSFIIWSNKWWYIIPIIAIPIFILFYRITEPGTYIYFETGEVLLMFTDYNEMASAYYLSVYVYGAATVIETIFSGLSIIKFCIVKRYARNIVKDYEGNLLCVLCIIFIVQLLRTAYSLTRSIFSKNIEISLLLQFILPLIADIYAWTGSITLVCVNSSMRKQYKTFYYDIGMNAYKMLSKKGSK